MKSNSPLTLSAFGFYVDEWCAHERRRVDVVVDLPDDSIVSAGDGDGGLVALNLTDAVELRNFIPLFYIPGAGGEARDKNTVVFKHIRKQSVCHFTSAVLPEVKLGESQGLTRPHLTWTHLPLSTFPFRDSPVPRCPY